MSALAIVVLYKYYRLSVAHILYLARSKVIFVLKFQLSLLMTVLIKITIKAIST